MNPPRYLIGKAIVLSLAIVAGSWMFEANAADASLPEGTKPNVVLILADDFGWTDLGCYGSDLYETPNIDRLAQQGMKFTRNYSACTVCSPSRAALLTGKYPARLHVTDWIPGLMPDNPKLLVPEWTKYLPLEETTLAEVFHSAGYVTASMGKWHLGGDDHVPEKQGFDINLAGVNAGAPPTYFSPYGIATLTDTKKGEYLTDRLAEEATGFIEHYQNRRFFLYLPHFAVHLPLEAPSDLVAKYKAKIKPGMAQTNATYAAMVESLDTAVGRVLQKLDELHLASRTIVIFTSDNGGRVPTTSNIGLRVGKGSAYEGGLRVPLIVRWPGVTKAGSVSETPVITMDLFPTLLEMAELTLPTPTSASGASGCDGMSLTPLLRGSGQLQRTDLFWHYPHHQHYQLGGSMPFGVIRSGDFKLIEFYNDMRVELYNLLEDGGEEHDLAAAQPANAAELRERLHTWRKEVGAQMPLPNPAHDPSRPEYTPAPAKAKNKKK